MSPSFAIITPSYAPDFQRCQLLANSVNQYIQPPFVHYIVVDRCDAQLFSSLANTRTRILTVESVLPRWIFREPIFRKVWLSWKVPPLRNWILQQIVKLAVAQQIEQDVAVFVDSDVIFVRPFDLNQLAQDDQQVRLYRDDQGNPVQRDMHRKWHASAAEVLGLSTIDPQIPDYIGNLITWRKQNVIQLCQHIEMVSGRGWIQTLAGVWNLSEYVLYGLFVDQVIPQQAQHYPDHRNFCHDYWLTECIAGEALQDWVSQLQPEQVAIMISAKSGMSVQDYAPLLAQMTF
ncbi:hypothetical protein IQ266_11790 [filamentous cyanobacterium LEGE 11480]|uniref:Uncharacterized protein n=1 Tax=Romeriopsis navalis LEGE 11480 TaxID=2777977 RepID=A0A928VQU0_9CYAN|nr:DUF6492 family protein [Romeriopsis navalis]MBE9030414.1 hypothetical protein [Romeriopsis navalis LEGE 11480]